MTAIHMKLEGRTYDEIEAALPVKRRTLYAWFMDPLVKQELQNQMERMQQVFAEKMAGLGVAAMEGLLEMVKEEPKGKMTHHQRLEAIREILNRTMPIPQESNGDGDGQQQPVGINLNFGQQATIQPGQMTDEELRQKALELAGEMAQEKSEDGPKQLEKENKDE